MINDVLIPPDMPDKAGDSSIGIVFDSLGAITIPKSPFLLPLTPFVPYSGSNTMYITLNITSLTQTDKPFQINEFSNNGAPVSWLLNLKINQTGLIQGIYDNGIVEDLGHIALAKFRHPENLHALGDGTWEETTLSGPPEVFISTEDNITVDYIY